MASPSSTTAVIVPFYFGEEYLDDLVYGAKIIEAEYLILVLNGWNKEHAKWKSIKKEKRVVLVDPNCNLGFGDGVNKGAQRAMELGAEFLLIQNQDAALVAFNSALFRTAEKHLRVVCPVTWKEENGGAYNWFYKERILPQLDGDSTPELLFFPAWMWLLSTDTFREVGWFDRMYFMYGEDDDFAQRLCQKGGVFEVNFSFECVHSGGMEPTPSQKIQNWMKQGRNIARFNQLEDLWGRGFVLKMLLTTTWSLAKGEFDKIQNFHLLYKYFVLGSRRNRIRIIKK